MKIKQVEELVGITKKNIRFYEEQGLLNPERAENGYREYHQEDVERLMKIKLFRKLSIPIEEIRHLFAGTKRLEDCLDHHLDELDRQKQNLTKMQEVSRQIISQKISLEQLDVVSYLEQMEKMEKAGVEFMDVHKTDVRLKKSVGAAIGAIVMILLMAAMIGMMIWGNSVDPIPVGFLIFLIAIPGVMIVGIVIALIGRIREIKGGEEDEASKY